MQNTLNLDKKSLLLKKLEKCPSIENQEKRQQVLQKLPTYLSRSIEPHADDKVYLLNIVNVCSSYQEGLKFLFRAIKHFDEETTQFRELKECYQEPLGISIRASLSIEWLSGCSGCEVSFADLHEQLPEVLKNEVELVRLPILMDTKEYVPADIGMITGSIRTEHDIQAAHKMRENCKIIIALGTCPIYGGPHGSGYAHTAQELLEKSFIANPTTRTTESPSHVPQLLEDSCVLDAEIPVDVYIPGCPPHPGFIIDSLRTLLKLPGRNPQLEQLGRYNVCFECRRTMDKTGVKTLRRGYEGPFEPDRCFLSQGYLCFGSVALNRCHARCPNGGNVPCFGCGGPSVPIILEPQKEVGALVAERMAQLTDIPEESIKKDIEKQAKTHYAYAMLSPIFRHKPTSELRKWIRAS